MGAAFGPKSRFLSGLSDHLFRQSCNRCAAISVLMLGKVFAPMASSLKLTKDRQ